MEHGGSWRFGNNRAEMRVAADIELSMRDGGCDQEDPTTTTTIAPVSMAHLDQFTEGDWVEPVR